MNSLVILKDQQAVTTSINVAESFEKQHGHILRDVEALKEDVLNFEEMFLQLEYVNEYVFKN